jgi:DNA (cytosine-5)-methyltransferase 1
MSSKVYQLVCEMCGKPFEAGRRDAKTCGDTCRSAARRGEDRVRSQIVLSLFPGADLWGKAFNVMGFCVVTGPDILWGGDIRSFHVPSGRFDGVIGGPPCQSFSPASRMNGTDAENLIPEFLRIVQEAAPKWAVMENVVEAVPAAPDWAYTILEDYDCGGFTGRERAFWFYGIAPVVEPLHREGQRAHTITATSWTRASRAKKEKRHSRVYGGANDMKADEASRLQGYPGLGERMMQAWPLPTSGFGMSEHSKNVLAVHMLGNGVPRAMGEYVARHVKRQVQKRDDWDRIDLPPYPLLLQAGR